MYQSVVSMFRTRVASKVAASVLVIGCSMSLAAGAATSDDPEEEPAPTATLTLTFTEGPGKSGVRRVYACAEDCLVVNKRSGLANVHMRKYVATARKPNEAGQWVLAVPEGTYYLALETTDPDSYRRIGYLKTGEATPRVTTAAEEALLSPVVGATDLGTFTLYSLKDMSVPGRLRHGTMHVLGDEYFYTQMRGRRLPPGTRVVSTYRTCSGKKRRSGATANKQGSLTYDVEARASQVSKHFTWSTKLSHPTYADRVESFSALFTKEYKNGC